MATITSVKKKFDNLLILRQDICAIFDILKGKLEVLQKIYSDLIKAHAHKSYVFGIDSFHFQNELIETDYLNLKAAFNSIDNRIYCEYYNLYLMIQNYARKDIKEEKLTKSVSFNQKFAPYKHLQQDNVYDIKVIKDMHLAIAACIVELESLLTAREADLRNDRQQSELGLNIDNLVYTEMFANQMLKAKIMMFYRYLEVFNEHHVKYFTRLLLKAKLHMGIVNEDIMIKQFNQSATTDIEKLQKTKIVNNLSPHNLAIGTEENEKIKSYIQFDSMAASKQNVLNGIMAKAGFDDSSSGTSSDDNENIDLEVTEHNTDLLVRSPKSEKPRTVAVLETVDEQKEFTIPEESEIASNVGEITGDFTEEDLGKRVFVEGYDCVGTLRFYGPHVSKPGMRCGVELDDAIGRNNGTVGEHEYFKCEPLTGVLVAPYKVKLAEGDESDSDEPL